MQSNKNNLKRQESIIIINVAVQTRPRKSKFLRVK